MAEKFDFLKASYLIVCGMKREKKNSEEKFNFKEIRLQFFTFSNMIEDEMREIFIYAECSSECRVSELNLGL